MDVLCGYVTDFRLRRKQVCCRRMGVTDHYYKIRVQKLCKGLLKIKCRLWSVSKSQKAEETRGVQKYGARSRLLKTSNKKKDVY